MILKLYLKLILLDKFAKAKFFSTLDFSSGYWQIPIQPRDTEKLAFVITFGLFEWLVLPFRLINAPAMFNHTTRRILNKYKIDFACNYFEDIIAFSQSKEGHSHYFQKLFIFVYKKIKN